MSSPERFPDLEIYLKRVSSDDTLAWLRSVFKRVEVIATDPATRCQVDQMACTISENVAKGGYTSLWFKSNMTPWSSDVEMARAAYSHFNCEIRCSTGGWKGEDDGGWLRITDKGEQTVNWHST